MPEAPRAPRSVPPWAASRTTMLEVWRCVCAADDADAGDATLVGCADAGAAGACFAWAMKPVRLSAAIAANVMNALLSNRCVELTQLRSDDRGSENELKRRDLIDTSSRITNRVANLRVANRWSMRKRDGRETGLRLAYL